MKRNIILCFNPHNAKGNTAVPKSIIKEFAYKDESGNPVSIQEKSIYGTVTIKDIEVYRDFFDQYNVSMEIIYKLLLEYQAKINVKKEFIEVEYKMDRWRIVPIDKSMVHLLHNNYMKGLYTARYYAEGYHVQRTTSFTKALEYIVQYDYKRIHCSEEVIEEKLKKVFTNSLTKRYEEFLENK